MLYYAVATVVSTKNGFQPRSEGTQPDVTPAWKIRLQRKIESLRGGVHSTERNGTESWTKLRNGTLSQNEACSLPLLKLPF